MIYVFLAEGFEEIEAVTVIDVLRRAGMDVKTVAITGELQVIGAHQITVTADISVEEVDLDRASAIVFPGGMPGTDNLDRSEDVGRLIFQAHKENKVIAAICAAPMILGKRGWLKGKDAVCFPGFEKYLEGANVKTVKAVISEKIVTSRGAGTAMDFACKILEVLGKKDVADGLKQNMLYDV